jgi:putative flippase GtrA
VGNRYWTFRRRRQATPVRELVQFVFMNVIGMLIAVACLAISHDLLGFTSSLADNISGNLIGIGLGTLFRFWAYRRFVFTETQPVSSDEPVAAAR